MVTIRSLDQAPIVPSLRWHPSATVNKDISSTLLKTLSYPEPSMHTHAPRDHVKFQACADGLLCVNRIKLENTVRTLTRGFAKNNAFARNNIENCLKTSVAVSVPLIMNV